MAASPIALDELQNRDVVGIGVADVPPVVKGETMISGIRGPSPKKSSG